MASFQSKAKGMSKQPSGSSNMLSRSIPVQITNVSTFDDTFSFLKERFASEMRRMDEEMNKLSMNLIQLYGQSSSGPLNWDSLASSPLIFEEGDGKMMKLQFDLSQFNPNEIEVKITNDLLVITASHSQKTDTTSVTRQFKREFLMPKGTDPKLVQSTLSRDGVLRIQAPLPKVKPHEIDKMHLEIQEQESSVMNVQETAITPSKEASVKDVQAKGAPVKPAIGLAPSKEAPPKVVPSKEAPPKVVPSKEAPPKVVPSKEAPPKVVPSKEAPPKVVPSKEAPPKVVPSKEAPAKGTPSKEAPAKVNPSKEAPTKETSSKEVYRTKVGSKKGVFEKKRTIEHKKAKEQMAVHDETPELKAASVHRALEIEKDKVPNKTPSAGPQ